MLTTLSVDLGARSYPILIGSGLLSQRGVLDPYLRHRDVLVVSNEIVAPIYLGPLKALLTGSRIASVILPDGEQHKSMATVSHVLDALVVLLTARADAAELRYLPEESVPDECGLPMRMAYWQPG